MSNRRFLTSVVEELSTSSGTPRFKVAVIVVKKYAHDYPFSQAEIGELLGVTRERIRQIEKSARTKLKRAGKLKLVEEEFADAIYETKKQYC